MKKTVPIRRRMRIAARAVWMLVLAAGIGVLLSTGDTLGWLWSERTYLGAAAVLLFLHSLVQLRLRGRGTITLAVFDERGGGDKADASARLRAALRGISAEVKALGDPEDPIWGLLEVNQADLDADMDRLFAGVEDTGVKVGAFKISLRGIATTALHVVRPARIVYTGELVRSHGKTQLCVTRRDRADGSFETLRAVAPGADESAEDGVFELMACEIVCRESKRIPTRSARALHAFHRSARLLDAVDDAPAPEWLLKEARRHLERAVAEDPEFLIADLHRAIVLRKVGELSVAEGVFARVRASMVDDSKSRRLIDANLALIELRKGNSIVAYEQIRALLAESAPSDPVRVSSLQAGVVVCAELLGVCPPGGALEADIERDMQQWLGWLTDRERADLLRGDRQARIRPRHLRVAGAHALVAVAALHERRADHRAAADRGAELEAAAEQLAAAVSGLPQHVEARRALARVLARLERHDEARIEIEEAIALEERPSPAPLDPSAASAVSAPAIARAPSAPATRAARGAAAAPAGDAAADKAPDDRAVQAAAAEVAAIVADAAVIEADAPGKAALKRLVGERSPATAASRDG